MKCGLHFAVRFSSFFLSLSALLFNWRLIIETLFTVDHSFQGYAAREFSKLGVSPGELAIISREAVRQNSCLYNNILT